MKKVQLPVVQDSDAWRRKTRRRTLSPLRLTREEVAEGQELTIPEDVKRPRKRGDCVDGPRPCPWVGCRHHLFLDVTEQGGLKLNFPELEVHDLEETCSLDVADQGGRKMEQIAAITNVTRQRIDQIEKRSLEWLLRSGVINRDGELRGSPQDATRRMARVRRRWPQGVK